MKKIRVAGFVRDMGTANVVSPILLEAQKRGHLTTLFIENGGMAEGRVKHPYKVVEDVDGVYKIFEQGKPDVVIAGLSAPGRNLESVFEKVARAGGHPVVHAEDSIAAFMRSALSADLILSIDKTAAALARARRETRVVVVGSGGVTPIVLQPEIVEAFKRIRRETGAKILYCNDADPRDSASTLKLLVESILLTRTPVRLIFVPHPKFASVSVGGGRTQGELLLRILGPLRAQNLLVPCPAGADGAPGAMLSDMTCSGYSTLLARAAASGKIALTLRTSEATLAYKAYNGLDETWLMMKGGFPVIEKPAPLDDILAAPAPPFDVKPLDVSRAVREIIRIVS